MFLRLFGVLILQIFVINPILSSGNSQSNFKTFTYTLIGHKMQKV